MTTGKDAQSKIAFIPFHPIGKIATPELLKTTGLTGKNVASES